MLCSCIGNSTHTFCMGRPATNYCCSESFGMISGHNWVRSACLISFNVITHSCCARSNRNFIFCVNSSKTFCMSRHRGRDSLKSFRMCIRDGSKSSLSFSMCTFCGSYTCISFCMCLITSLRLITLSMRKITIGISLKSFSMTSSSS